MSQALAAPRRAHAPPAARVPVGPRAGRALDRPAHGRGGLRARRRRATRATTPSCSTSSATCCSRSTSCRCCSRSAAPGRPGRRSPSTCRQKLIRRHPHVFGERRGRDAPARCCATGTRSSATEPGREPGIFGEVPENLPGPLYARKVQRRAASSGFDFEHVPLRRGRRRARGAARRPRRPRGALPRGRRRAVRRGQRRAQAARSIPSSRCARRPTASAARRGRRGLAAAAARLERSRPDEQLALLRPGAAERDGARMSQIEQRPRPPDPRLAAATRPSRSSSRCAPARAGRAAVPSGASTGEFEAIELRDGGDALGGKGVTQAVAQRQRRDRRGGRGPRRRRPGRRSTAR